MKHYPMYAPHTGTNKEVFDGIKAYLYSVKSTIEADKKEFDNLTHDEVKIKEMLNASFKGEVDKITRLTKMYEDNKDKLLVLSNRMRDNETIFLSDLINLFCD